MTILERPQTDPWFNIAAEEYLLKSKSDDYFMLWQNQPAVIVGKHQNTLAEINFHFLRENNIPVIRRITGGGAVYHDLGNLNFSYIHKGEKGKLVDFKKFIDPIINALKHMGVDAKFEGKNNIRINDFKVSGNSEHVYKNRVLHHGTLLFSSDLDILNQAIKSSEKKFIDKSVKSIRTQVANISDFLKNTFDIDQFREHIVNYFIKRNKVSVVQELENEEINEIEKLVNSKYKTWDWNFGYSPEYSFRNQLVLKSQLIELYIKVRDGKILKAEIKIEGKDDTLDKLIQEILIGCKHEFQALKNLLEKSREELNKWHLNPDIMLQLLF